MFPVGQNVGKGDGQSSTCRHGCPEYACAVHGFLCRYGRTHGSVRANPAPIADLDASVHEQKGENKVVKQWRYWFPDIFNIFLAVSRHRVNLLTLWMIVKEK